MAPCSTGRIAPPTMAILPSTRFAERSRPFRRDSACPPRNVPMTGRDPAARMIGVDIGGTKVAAGLVDAVGTMSQFLRAPMNPRGTAEEGFAAVSGVLDAL